MTNVITVAYFPAGTPLGMADDPGTLVGVAVTVAEAREVVEDYTRMGLSFRWHPFAFMRHDLARQKIATCANVLAARDGTWLTVGGDWC